MPHDIPVAPTTLPWFFSAGFSRSLAIVLSLNCAAWSQQTATLAIRLANPNQLQQSLQNTRGEKFTVVVEDGSGAPVEQAAVSFRLPDQGPSGLFANGLRSEIVITGADGRASVAAIQWEGTPGTVSLRVTAAKAGMRAGTVLNIDLKADANPIVLGASIKPPQSGLPADLQTPKYQPPGFWTSKWLVVALAAGGALAGGYAVTRLRRSPSVDPYAITPGGLEQAPVVIGLPLITVGKP